MAYSKLHIGPHPRYDDAPFILIASRDRRMVEAVQPKHLCYKRPRELVHPVMAGDDPADLADAVRGHLAAGKVRIVLTAADWPQRNVLLSVRALLS